MSFSLTSLAFEHERGIPARYTCDGDDVSPPLRWDGAPVDTRAFALIVIDPDAPDPRAPRTTWVHWMLYDVPADVRELAENVAELPRGTREGLNGWKRTGWAGPCPLIGRHRYFFELYALRRELGELDHPRRGELIAAMEGLVLAKTVLMGTYERAKKR